MKPARDYFAATMPEPWTILGLRLRAFSLGHYKLLRRFGCGFVSDDPTVPTREDLILGVLCCSMTPAGFLEFIDSPGYLQEVQEWGTKIGLFDLNEKAQMFKDYIEANSVMPLYWEEKQGGSSGAHWAQSVEVCLRSKLGWTQAEIDSEPLSKCFADYFKFAENEGAVKLMTSEEIALVTSRQEAAASGS